MILAHRIALDPNREQADHFRKACGVARFAYNWALTEWQEEYKAGGKPSAAKLKAQWNAIRGEQYPWSKDVTKCASAQAITNLGTAYANFFRDLKKASGQKARGPRLKKKGRRDSFTVWNDQFVVKDDAIRLPHVGWVRMREPLRFTGKVLRAVVKREADRWFVAVQVECDNTPTVHGVPGRLVGIDLGITTLMTLSRPLPDGRTAVANPKSRRRHMARMTKLQRRISRQELRRRRLNVRRSNRQSRRQDALCKLHYRVACVRKDAIHKATSLVAKHFETIVLETLNVAGMGKNHALAGAVYGAAFAEQRRQLEYKAVRRGGRVILADRWFPSSKTCSTCGCVVDKLPLSARRWECRGCGTAHDRDENAAKNLELVGQAMPKPLPDDPAATHGEIAALAGASASAKLRSRNREPNVGHTCGRGLDGRRALQTRRGRRMTRQTVPGGAA